MKDTFRRLADFEYWSLQQYLDRFSSLGSQCPDSARQLIGHILNAQSIWISRLEGKIPLRHPFSMVEMDGWYGLLADNHQRWLAYLEAQPDPYLSGAIRYQTTTGVVFQSPIRDVLLHLFGHASYHRGQLAQLLKATGVEIPSTDYIFWQRHHQRSTGPESGQTDLML